MTHGDRMTFLVRRAVAAGVLLAALGLSGCATLRTTWPTKYLFPPDGKTLFKMATDPDDPDRRREGITLLSQRDWAQNDTYRKYFQIALLQDSDPGVRSAAARALGKAGDPQYLPSLAQTLHDQDQPLTVRWDAAAALDNVIGDAAIPALREHALPDAEPSEDVRASCVRALRHYRTEPVVQTLVMALSDPAFGVRHQAHASLVEVTGQDLGFEPADWAPVIGKEIAPPTRAEWKRPRWDWFRVTKPKDAAVTTQPAKE